MEKFDLKTKPKKICLIGPSSSGKSTLAKRLGEVLDVPVLYMDQIAHIPHTKWQRRPKEETGRLHDEFIKGDTWVVEGNYSRYMPQRFERADLVVFHRFNRFGCLYRYIRRAKIKDKARAGMLEGGIESINWPMIKYILWGGPRKNKSYYPLLKAYEHLQVVEVHSFKDIDALVAKLSNL